MKIKQYCHSGISYW